MSPELQEAVRRQAAAIREQAASLAAQANALMATLGTEPATEGNDAKGTKEKHGKPRATAERVRTFGGPDSDGDET